MGLWRALQEFPWYFWRAAIRWQTVFAAVRGSALSDILQLLKICKKPQTKKKTHQNQSIKKEILKENTFLNFQK